MSEADDGELLTRVAEGDREALDLFVRRHRDHVFRYLRSLARTEADAEDALQEAFVAAWRGAHTYRGRGSARSWLLTVSRRALFKHRRRRAGEPEHFESLEDLGREAGWGGAEEDELLDRLARRDLLQRAFSALQDEDREILLLRDVEGFSGAEAAETLDLSLAAVKSRLHRARLRLTRALKELVDVRA